MLVKTLAYFLPVRKSLLRSGSCHTHARHSLLHYNKWQTVAVPSLNTRCLLHTVTSTGVFRNLHIEDTVYFVSFLQITWPTSRATVGCIRWSGTPRKTGDAWDLHVIWSSPKKITMARQVLRRNVTTNNTVNTCTSDNVIWELYISDPYQLHSFISIQP